MKLCMDHAGCFVFRREAVELLISKESTRDSHGSASTDSRQACPVGRTAIFFVVGRFGRKNRRESGNRQSETPSQTAPVGTIFFSIYSSQCSKSCHSRSTSLSLIGGICDPSLLMPELTSFVGPSGNNSCDLISAKSDRTVERSQEGVTHEILVS